MLSKLSFSSNLARTSPILFLLGDILQKFCIKIKVWNILLIFDISNVKSIIVNFGNKETEKIWNGIVSKKLPREIQEVARRKLRMLNNSIDVTDLRIPPANRLEKLKGDLKQFYCVRINNQWRIIFKWKN